jgi:predicted nucleotidyltransferase
MNAEEKMYQAFFDLKEDRLYYNQLKEYAQLSHSSLQNVLEKLTASGILAKEKTKSNTFYRINNKKLFALKFSECAMNKFNSLNANIKVPLRNFLKDLPKETFTVILFGSASRKEEQKSSDIDLLIVIDKNVDLSRNKREAELTAKHTLSLCKATVEEFFAPKDDVVVQARKTGFPIYKEQNFYEVLLG